MRLVVTRPEPDGERTAVVLRARGHDVLLAPMLRIQPVRHADFGKGPWSAVLTTSANASRAVAEHPRRSEIVRLPLFTVGRHSAAAAREAGFTDVQSADGDAGDLVDLVRRRLGSKHPLLYLSGEHRAQDISGALEREGWPVTTVAVYRAEALRTFPPNLAAALSEGSVGGVLHFSRRSAEAYLACAEAGPLRREALRPIHFCLSAQVGEPLAGAPDVRIAAQPQEASLLALIPS